MSSKNEESDLKSQSRISIVSRPSTTESRPSTGRSLITLSSISYGNSDSEISQQSIYADVPLFIRDELWKRERRMELEQSSRGDVLWIRERRMELEQSSRGGAPWKEVTFKWTEQPSRGDAPLEEVPYIGKEQSYRGGGPDLPSPTLPPEDGVAEDRLWCWCFTCPKKRKKRPQPQSMHYFHTRRRRSISSIV